jgi:sugar/nucleoside kinase (ribokinase family)
MIICIGNPVYDLIETPLISTNGRVLSGCSTNACLVLAKLGASSWLTGQVGGDFYDRFLADMTRYHIECFVTRSKETGGFSLIYDHTGNRTLDVLGIAEPISVLPDNLAQAEMVLFGPILSEIDLALIEAARQKTAAPFFLDPQGLLRRLDGTRRIEHYFNPDLPRILPYFDFVKANEYETELITGINPRQDTRGATKKLYDFGCRVAIVTLAEAGSALYDGRHYYRIPAYTTIAKDPTGAGDSYAGSFIYRYLHNQGDLRDAAYFASSASSIMVEYTGSDFPMELTEVERRMQVLLG